ncbi:hypothetical protein [Catellatospora sichuanensis]|uniref:hypothetical protein n=1 Tax=Catellatospora sichuanensis TaxID=1969805 RepID=UPI0011823319|nr:hypothetical protein [Catellatospora sichuanensis]
MIEPSAPPSASSTATPIERPPWTLIAPGLSAMFAACQLAVLLSPVRSALQRDLDVTAAGLAVAVVSQLVAAMLGAALGYVLGRRAPTSVVGAGLTLMLLGAVVTALSNTSAMVVAAGLVVGFGAGAVLGAAAGLTGQVGERRGQVRLALGLAVCGGLVGGLLLGWFVSTVLSWRLVYLSTVVLILAALVATAVGGVVASTRASR